MGRLTHTSIQTLNSLFSVSTHALTAVLFFCVFCVPTPSGPEVENGDDGHLVDVRRQVQERMDVKERTHDFRFTFGDDGDDEQVYIYIYRQQAAWCTAVYDTLLVPNTAAQ